MGLGDARPLMESSLEAVDIGTASTSNGDIGGVQSLSDWRSYEICPHLRDQRYHVHFPLRMYQKFSSKCRGISQLRIDAKESIFISFVDELQKDSSYFFRSNIYILSSDYM